MRNERNASRVVGTETTDGDHLAVGCHGQMPGFVVGSTRTTVDAATPAQRSAGVELGDQHVETTVPGEHLSAHGEVPTDHGRHRHPALTIDTDTQGLVVSGAAEASNPTRGQVGVAGEFQHERIATGEVGQHGGRDVGGCHRCRGRHVARCHHRTVDPDGDLVNGVGTHPADAHRPRGLPPIVEGGDLAIAGGRIAEGRRRGERPHADGSRHLGSDHDRATGSHRHIVHPVAQRSTQGADPLQGTVGIETRHVAIARPCRRAHHRG